MTRNSFALGAMMGGGSYGGGTICEPGDDTFFCKLNRLTSEIHMLLFLVILVALPIYYFVKYYKNK